MLFDISIISGIRKNSLFIFGILIYSQSLSQKSISGYVQEMSSGKPLAYVSVVVMGTTRGTISNKDGYFSLDIYSGDSILQFYYIGFDLEEIRLEDFQDELNIFLKKIEYGLNEVVVRSDKSYLYEMFEKSRNLLKKTQPYKAKIYAKTVSDETNNPIELIEGFYNGQINNYSVSKMRMKNGRIALSTDKDHFFINLTATKVFDYINIVKRKEFFPVIPFQLTKRKLNKYYELNHLYTFSDSVAHIEFKPKFNKQLYFEGFVWINIKDYSIVRLELKCIYTKSHPFIPLSSINTMKNVDIELDFNYIKYDNQNYLHLVEIRYAYQYHFKKGSLKYKQETGVRSVKTNTLLYIYDYNKEFILPFFKYNNDQGDYRTISMVALNKDFWKINQGISLTRQEKQRINYFLNNGYILSYEDFKINFEHSSGPLFRYNNIRWSDSSRIKVNENIKNSNSLSQEEAGHPIISTLYNFSVQIFFDMNETNDSIQYYSATIFDVFNTYYYLPSESYTNCFLNIYFDLFEIERLKMNKVLHSKKWTNPDSIRSIYKKHVQIAKETANLYLGEVQTGKNWKNMKKWNEYVLEELGVNNIELFEL